MLSTQTSAFATQPIRLNKGGLNDPGANICMTNRLALILNMRLLDTPLKVGVAVSEGGADITEFKCTHMGDLPFTLTNGGCHYQPYYYNPLVTNTFIALDAICTASKGLLTT